MTTAHGQPWDLLVLGGGTAGIIGSKTAASLGASVVLIEKDRTGGDCLWTGCVPSKSLLASARAVADARRASRLGVIVSGVSVDFTAVMAHVHAAIRKVEPADSVESLEAAGVTVISGTGRFTGPGRLAVGDTELTFRQALLATGGRPAVPPIPGLDAVAALTSDSLWDLEKLPVRLAVLGGGSIGCELGQAFARLGSAVTIVEGADRILPREDPSAAALVHASLARDGATVLTGRPVVAVDGRGDGSGTLTVGTGDAVVVVDFDRLLVAVGRSPNTSGCGLEAIGVDLDKRGFVVVDSALRSTNKRIWAAGDISGHPQFTHTAGVHGSLAASNAVLGLRRKVDMSAIPRVTFTEPEVAAVGLPTSDEERPEGISVVTLEHQHVDRAVADDDTAGFVKISVNDKGQIVGGTIVGPRAGETLAEITLAVRKRLRTRDIANTTHPYPTYGDGPWNATIGDVRARLERPALARVTRVLLRWKRARTRLS